ncbi:hypothetical protein [Glaciimonas sp. PAMC28666]|uniref:hypothetical protein n=1 Tax=Glaciimonas sp. PAMC28666 TaxID=2807626 RepID=UPI0019628B4F|nr:hypothetical protein [Glaciimonas sp. PAMC28666]QRX82575.1 hypothetical protein JQN73_21325 [Glaciimonas sp. PAMC28666]
MTNQTIRLSKVSKRLQWEWYRIAGVCGLPGLTGLAVLIVALVAHTFFLDQSIIQLDAALKENASLQMARTKELKSGLLAASVPTSAFVYGKETILDLAHTFQLDTREVKYQQMQRGKGMQKESRILITLPTVGRYPQFRGLMEELAATPGGAVETFSLTRKNPSEEMLTIEMRLSVAGDEVKQPVKDKSAVTQAQKGRTR